MAQSPTAPAAPKVAGAIDAAATGASPAATAAGKTEANGSETEVVVTVEESLAPGATHPGNSTTQITRAHVELNPAPRTLNNIIASLVPGAAALPNGAIRIRGSDNQFSYYLDGAPLPANVSAFITDQINPRNLESLTARTGAFSARYGGQLSAVFDARTKMPASGTQEGFLQAGVGNFGEREAAFQYGSSEGRTGVFVSALASRTDFRLSPITREALHNGGREQVGFARVDYRLGERDKLTFHLGGQDARLEVPNSPDRQVLGQDNRQREEKGFFNAIWRRDADPTVKNSSSWSLAAYSHASTARYSPSAADLVPSPPDPADPDPDDLISVSQRQRVRYNGVRWDYSRPLAQGHRVGMGLEWRQASGNLDFSVVADPSEGFAPLVDQRRLKSSDVGVYLEEEWERGPWSLNYGARLDRHSSAENGTYAQVSPRVNLTHRAGKDTYYAFYNRLWMPVPIESIRMLEGDSPLGDLERTRIRPEIDDYYGLGWKRRAGKSSLTLDAYYKAIHNIIDNQEIGETLIEVPINEAQGIVKGLEVSFERALARRFTFGATYGISRGTASGPVTGGLFGLEELPPGFFVDDHDQTHIASAAFTYAGKKTAAVLEAQYESGLPYGEEEDADDDPIRINYLRAPAQYRVNALVRRKISNGLNLSLAVTNILDRRSVVVQDNVFRRPIYNQGRAFVLRAVWLF